MIRNYNGNVNRAVIRDLRKLCDVNAKNERKLFDVFDQNGKVCVYENLDQFTGCPDELSTIVTLKSEEEIKRYLKKDFIKRVERYLDHRKPAEDHLLSALIEFVKDNGRFPERAVMSYMEKQAEKKRIAELPADVADGPKEITEQDIAKEILELAEEIMESRRENSPEDIWSREEPYPEILSIETDDYHVGIKHKIWYGFEDFRDYECTISIKDHHDVATISICYLTDGTLHLDAEDFYDDKLDMPLTSYMINIHKSIAKMAKEAGFEFTSEIDYKKFQIA